MSEYGFTWSRHKWLSHILSRFIPDIDDADVESLISDMINVQSLKSEGEFDLDKGIF